MWKTLYSYENYCHECILPIWINALELTLGAIFFFFMAFIYFHALKEELPKKISTKVFGYTVSLTIPRLENPRRTLFKCYCLFIVLSICITIFNSAARFIDETYPDDYLKIDEIVKDSKGKCVEGVIHRYNFKSLQGTPYSSVVFENGEEFRYSSSDVNRFCYKSARIFTGIIRLMADNFQINFKGDSEIGNVELRVCWARNVNSSFSDKEISKYDGICIYKIEAKLASK